MRTGQVWARPGKISRAGGSAALQMGLQVRDVAFFITFAKVRSVVLHMDLQVQHVLLFRSRSAVLHMDLQVQNLAFFLIFV